MNRDSYKLIKKFAHFQDECRHFDATLEDLQESLYHTSHINDHDFDLYKAAQSVRDMLFRLVRKMRCIPDETNPDDFDCGGGEVMRSSRRTTE